MNRILQEVGIISSVGMAAFLSVMVVMSWWGGDEGGVVLFTNKFHERLIETIVVPTAVALGVWGAISFLRGR